MDTAPTLFKLGKAHSMYIGGELVDEDEMLDIRACEMACPVRAISVFPVRGS